MRNKREVIWRVQQSYLRISQFGEIIIIEVALIEQHMTKLFSDITLMFI